MKVLHQPTLARHVLAGLYAGDQHETAPLQLLEPVAGPGDDVAHDSYAKRRSGRHHAGVGREVERDLDPIAPRAYSDPGRLAIRARDDQRHGEQVRQQKSELLNRAIAAALLPGELE